jgi:cell fate regulator YaaT (PSP1 superfamily)
MIKTVKLKSDGGFYKTDVGNRKVTAGDEVLLEGEHGTEIGVVVEPCCGKEYQVESGAQEEKNFTFIRKLSEKDKEQAARLAKEAKTYLIECQSKVDKYSLPMELIDADLSFDEKKITFYFTAPGRVDFRSLVSELAHTFKKVIRLQQIGSRDEARYLGGVARCGREFCCKKFLRGNLESVTLDMAQEQYLAQMGQTRVTGACGKLMCCLKYELEFYKEVRAKLPPIGEEIKTKEGLGKVISHNVFENKVTVKLNENDKYLEVAC